MTLIDSSIIKSQINKLDFKRSFIQTSNEYIENKINFRRPFGIMFLVYSSTYSTANLVELYCKKNNIDYKIPTFISTSIVNILTIAYKDKEYSKMFNTKYNIFPKISYGLISVRDMITIYSCFIFKKDFMNYLSNYMPKNTADFVSSITIPIAAQTISTPIHILAIDYFQRPEVKLVDRIKHIKSMYIPVCTGRIIRVLPAFCIGGFINDMLRNRNFN
jgi:hypothetical protein